VFKVFIHPPLQCKPSVAGFVNFFTALVVGPQGRLSWMTLVTVMINVSDNKGGTSQAQQITTVGEIMESRS